MNEARRAAPNGFQRARLSSPRTHSRTPIHPSAYSHRPPARCAAAGPTPPPRVKLHHPLLLTASSAHQPIHPPHPHPPACLPPDPSSSSPSRLRPGAPPLPPARLRVLPIRKRLGKARHNPALRAEGGLRLRFPAGGQPPHGPVARASYISAHRPPERYCFFCFGPPCRPFPWPRPLLQIWRTPRIDLARIPCAV
jgi:hypothetical protein